MNDSLKTIVAELLAVSPDQVGADRILTGARLQGSLGRSILDAAMRRRLGIQSQACYTAKTYGELEAAINGSAVVSITTETTVTTNEEVAAATPVLQETLANPAAPLISPRSAVAPARFSQGSQSSACGVDIELIENMPVTTDFWSHEFYTTNFTPGEIAYCLTQQSPSHHFAARWCAKEALKKCEPTLLPEQMRNIEIVSRADGTPSLWHHANGTPTQLPHAISLSHTNHAAVAVVMRVSSPPPPSPQSISTVAPMPSMMVPPPPPSRKLGMLTFAFSFLAIVLAIISLSLVLHHH